MTKFIQGADGSMSEIEDLILDKSCSLSENQNRSVTVRGAATSVTILSRVNGAVLVEDQANIDLIGTVNGSLTVAPGSSVSVHGRQNGSVYVTRGAKLRIVEGGVVAGSIRCDGELFNDGTRVSNSYGVGSITDGPSGTVRRPDRIEPGGISIYHW